MSEYTPTEGQMLTAWLIASGASRMHGAQRERAHAEFDRFLARIKANAWDEGRASAGIMLPTKPPQQPRNPHRKDEQ